MIETATSNAYKNYLKRSPDAVYVVDAIAEAAMVYLVSKNLNPGRYTEAQELFPDFFDCSFNCSFHPSENPGFYRPNKSPMFDVQQAIYDMMVKNGTPPDKASKKVAGAALKKMRADAAGYTKQAQAELTQHLLDQGCVHAGLRLVDGVMTEPGMSDDEERAFILRQDVGDHVRSRIIQKIFKSDPTLNQLITRVVDKMLPHDSPTREDMFRLHTRPKVGKDPAA